MAAERHAPDALLETSGFSGTPVVASIQDDPDTPDANWFVASSNNVATIARVSFPTPTGSPTTGAGLQNFRARVRKTALSGTGTPQARIDLYEGGVLRASGTNASVLAGAGNVIQLAWNASLLTTGSGASVEARVVTTQSGGAGSVRAAADVGAVEWNAEVTTAQQKAGADESGPIVAPGDAVTPSDLRYEGAALSSAIPQTDTGTAAESATVQAGGAGLEGQDFVAVEEAATAADQTTTVELGAIEWQLAYNAPSLEYAQVQKLDVYLGTDTGTSSETGEARVPVAGTDTGTSSDTAAVPYAPPVSDTGAATETGALLVDQDDNPDDAAGTETETLAATAAGADAAAATDAGSLDAAEQKAGSDVNGTPVETAVVASAAIPASDAATGSDNAALAVAGSDAGAASETAALTATVAAADTNGTVTEQGALSTEDAKADSDTNATPTETAVVASATLAAVDVGSSSETAAYTYPFAVSDTGAGSETGTRSATVADTGAAAETTTANAVVSGSDSGAALDQGANQTANEKAGTDTNNTTESATFTFPLVGSDGGSATDAATITVTLGTAETMAALDAAILAVSALLGVDIATSSDIGENFGEGINVPADLTLTPTTAPTLTLADATITTVETATQATVELVLNR